MHIISATGDYVSSADKSKGHWKEKILKSRDRFFPKYFWPLIVWMVFGSLFFSEMVLAGTEGTQKWAFNTGEPYAMGFYEALLPQLARMAQFILLN